MPTDFWGFCCHGPHPFLVQQTEQAQVNQDAESFYMFHYLKIQGKLVNLIELRLGSELLFNLQYLWWVVHQFPRPERKLTSRILGKLQVPYVFSSTDWQSGEISQLARKITCWHWRRCFPLASSATNFWAAAWRLKHASCCQLDSETERVIEISIRVCKTF